MRIRVALIENLERPRRMYQRILSRLDGAELVEVFCYAEELLEQLRMGLELDVIVMDVRMDDDLNGSTHDRIDGIEAARRIRATSPRMPFILYSMWENPEYYRRIDQARFGTRYAFVKRYSLDDWDRMGEIIRRVVRGEAYIDPEVRIEMDLLKERSETSPLRQLENDDQRKVLTLMADALNNDDIAHVLSRSTRWVEEAIKVIYQLLGLSGIGNERARAIRMFHENRVLRWEEQHDKTIALLAQNRMGDWDLLQTVKAQEDISKEDAKILNNAAG